MIGRRTAATAAVLVGAAGLLTACTDGAEMAQEYVDHVAEEPLEGGRVMVASGYKDTSECGCSWMRVVFRIDGVDELPASQDAVAANLASVLQHACDWDPTDSLEERWLVERIGQWREPSVTPVIAGDSSRGPAECDEAAVESGAADLVDRVVRTMAVPGVAAESEATDFGWITLDSRTALPRAVPALVDIWGEDEVVTVSVVDDTTDVDLGTEVTGRSHYLEAIDTLLRTVPADREVATVSPTTVCDDCTWESGDTDPVTAPTLAVGIVIDATQAEVDRWARAAGIPTTPQELGMMVAPLTARGPGDAFHFTEAQLRELERP